MTSREIILRITNDKIWFNETDFIEISFTDIPSEHLRFTSHGDIFWKAEMKRFDESVNRLFLDILDYSHVGLSEFLNQKLKKQITYLEFGKFDWPNLQPLLTSYQKIKFIGQLTNAGEGGYGVRKINESPTYKSDSFEGQKLITKQNSGIATHREPVVIKLEEEFSVDFNGCAFMLGSVKFSKHIKRLNQTVDLKIINEIILPEFDNIKSWFSKRLKIKKFKVKAVFTLIDNQLTEYSATSEDIDKIDQSLIEGVKLQRTLAITKLMLSQDMDKSLFTSEDLFSLDTEKDLKGNVFKQTETDILDLLIEKNNVRNKKELTHLAESKQSINYRIRFTTRPGFGFVFLAEGELNNHFIWELLNSHATYIWTIEKAKTELETQYKGIESIINKILVFGREQYKREYRTAYEESDLTFNLIHHQDKSSQFIDAFAQWKHKIDQLIT